MRNITDFITEWLTRYNTDLKDKLSGDTLMLETYDSRSQVTTPLHAEATAEATDLFNVMASVFVTTVNTRKDGSHDHAHLTQKRMWASQGAAATNPNSPMHIEMVNNLLGESTSAFNGKTNLSRIDKGDWRRLRNHLDKINQYPRCICHNVRRVESVVATRDAISSQTPRLLITTLSQPSVWHGYVSL